MARFSARSRFHAVPNRLTEACLRVRAQGVVLCDLSESNPTRAGLALDDAALRPLLAQSAQGVASYAPEPFGLRSAREAVACDLAERGCSLDARDVLLTSSTSEAYGYLFKLLCDPGDSVLVPAPSYPLFDVLAQLEQVRLVPYPLAYDGEWHVELGALAAAVDAHTRAVITVHPNNPTGSYLKLYELTAVASLGLPIVSDEVFADYALRAGHERVESALVAAPEALVFRLGGLSKAVALPQLKLAWTALAGPPAQLDEARARLEHIADAYLSPGAQVQLALPQLLAESGAVQARILARVRQNLDALHSTLVGSAASVLTVEGGWYAIVRLPAVLDDEAWALTLLEQDGVLVQPGYYYELTAFTCVVVSLIVAQASFAEGARRLRERVLALAG